MTVILYNPKAHSDAGERETRAWVEAHGESVADMKSILEVEDMGAFVAALDADDRLILCGGDGTLTRFANALRHVDVKVPVYLTAVGTGNDFLCDLRNSGVTEDPVQINDYLKNLPVVYVNGIEHTFINGIGYGLDGYCCEVGDALAAQGKKINYSGIAVKGILGKFKVRNADITVDGVTKHYEKVWLAPTMNGRYYGGGLMFTPFQDRLNAERTVTVAVMYRSGKLKTLLSFLKIPKGQHTTLTDIYEARVGHEITVRFDSPCALQIDGETILNVSEYTVRSAPRAAEYDKEREAAAEAEREETRQEEPVGV